MQQAQASEAPSLTIDDLLVTSELQIRPKRRSRRAMVSALQVLSQEIAEHPSEALPRLVALAQELCGGGSAGISVYEPQPGSAGIFRWSALSGKAAQFYGVTTPRDFSPCGICLDRAETIVMDRPGRYYDWLNLPNLPLIEAVLVPMFINGTEPFGTLWVMSHDEHKFDSEDAQILAEMASVVGMALSLISRVAHKEMLGERAKHQSAKLEALGQLTGGIAHDFNNLLTILTGELELIRERVEEKKLRAMLDRGLESLTHGEKLVQHLLAFARQEPLHLEVIDLRSKLDGIVETLIRLFPQTKVNAQITDELWPAFTDQNLLEAAILNLAINARDAMSGGGTLTIEAKNAHLENGPNENGRAGDFIALSIADAGTGMTPEILQHAFEPFFTTKGVGTGTGLGLSMVHDFAVQCGGVVTIQSEVGKGTAITIYLPCATPSAQTDA
jgi:signal transduction histidine kinase